MYSHIPLISPLENCFSLKTSFLGKKLNFKKWLPKIRVPPQITGGDITPALKLSSPYTVQASS